MGFKWHFVAFVNLNKETVKILGAYFSYNKNLEQYKNFCQHIVKIENILKLWRMRQLTLEGRITVFKSLAISKVLHLLQLIFCMKYRKTLFGKGKRQKLNIVLFAMAMNREVQKVLT